MQRLLVVSNMYPSPSHPYYGNFVKISTSELQPYFKVSRQVLTYHSGVIFKAISYLGFYIKTTLRLFAKRPDIVYYHYPSYCLPIICLNLLFKSGSLVLNFHGSDLNASSPIAKSLLKILSKKVHCSDLVIVPSKYFSKRVSEMFPRLECSKVFVYPSGGIDTSIFRPIGTIKTFDFIYVSSINPNKGFSVFINALEQLKAVFGLTPKVCVIGRGEARYISQVLENSEVAEYVNYIGVVKHSRLSEYLNASRYFVFPTLYQESLGLVCLEAMSCGVPVIASKIEATKEYIVEGENGFLFKQNSKIGLMKVMKQALEFTDYPALTEHALKVAASYSRGYNTTRLVKRLEQLKKIR